MKISLITVSFNSERTIRETLESTVGQNQVKFEHIIVDGGSRDSTNHIIQAFAENSLHINHSIGPDKGLYDAMNKGVKKALGDVVGFLNSDDILADEFVVRDISRVFQEHNADIVYGDIEIFADEPSRRVVRSWKSGVFRASSLQFGWHPPHPAFYMRRSLFESLGGFDLGVGLSADYDLMVRALLTPGCRVAYIDRVLVKMRHGGASTSGFGPIFKGWKTCQSPWQKLGRPYTGLVAATLKPIRKLGQLRS
jgi:glycosyltransferase